MASTTIPKSPPTKPRKDREREKEKEKERKERAVQQPTERLKTVVRRLPANLPEEVFWQSVQNWVTDETVTWKTYYPGKLRKKLNKENIPSRAYIAFRSEEQLALFSSEYDGHLFRDKTGNESQAVVEFAPYPKVPAEKRKPDARNATIEKDEDYISFIESLKAAANAEPVTLEALIASARPPSPPKTTPLLEALKAEKSASKDKEAILRNHAHYKDVSLLRNKEEPKKKGAAGPAKQAPGESAGKKGKKGAAPPVASTPSQNQSQKAGQSTSGGGGGGGKNAPASAQANAKPPKPARQRQGQPPKVPAAHGAPPSSASTPAIAASASAAPSADAQAPSPAPRRARPMIGLASRQFEAALSGVGGTPAGERKSRREREKERQEKEKDGAAGAASSAATSTSAHPEKDKTAVPPNSPKRERGPRRGAAAGASQAPAAGASGDPQVVKVPGILQRIDGPPPAILQRETSKPAEGGGAPQATGVPAQGPVPGGNRGGGRRGRGRGRGGPPGATPRGG